MDKSEFFENLFVHLRKRIKLGVRLDLVRDQFMDEYYLNGTLRGTKFSIDLSEDGEVITTFNTGANEKNIKIVEESICEFTGEEPSVTYTLKDMNDPKKNMHVIEWTRSKERLDKIRFSEIVSFPHYVTDIDIKINDLGRTR